MKLPERWENYSEVGERIPNSPFLPMKCPLDKKFFADKRASKGEGKSLFTGVWTPQDVLQKFPDLSLLIDLTFTNRYYNGANMELCAQTLLRESSGTDTKQVVTFRHFKLKMEGRIIPPISVVKRFFAAVDGELARNQDAVIGVHCTHGVNRTGYLICRYLIERLKFNPKTATEEFAKARGHEIEREIYLQNLLAANWSKEGPETSRQTSERSHRSNKGHHGRRQREHRDYGSDPQWKNVQQSWRPKGYAQNSYNNQGTGEASHHHYQYNSYNPHYWQSVSSRSSNSFTHDNYRHPEASYYGQGYNDYVERGDRGREARSVHLEHSEDRNRYQETLSGNYGQRSVHSDARSNYFGHSNDWDRRHEARNSHYKQRDDYYDQRDHYYGQRYDHSQGNRRYDEAGSSFHGQRGEARGGYYGRREDHSKGRNRFHQPRSS